MKVTFPLMGNSYIAFKALLKGLDLEVILPPPITQRTLALGSKYAPECACLPLKTNVGNFIEALELGADTIVMAGGWGPCRFGYYAQIQRGILEDLGYSFNMVVFEPPDTGFDDLIEQARFLGGGIRFKEALSLFKFAWNKLIACEKLEKAIEFYLPRSEEKEQALAVYRQGLQAIDMAESREEVHFCADQSIQRLKNLSCRNDIQPLKIGLLGEIFTILEPGTNYYICETLGLLGVEVKRSIYLTDWINDHLLAGLVKKSRRKKIIKRARPYINYWVGGHGRETVGYAVEYARRGYDGLIQIGPLTCMPEIVAQTVLPRVSEDKGIPVMTLWFDEQSSAAGIQTRLEAFIDMLQRQKSSYSREVEA
ncbi:MAG TPA: CoA protein activase [Syntrophomonadaceae bacterium]|nr:CoA protein activase [Syntrophomonadaceae bacterium]